MKLANLLLFVHFMEQTTKAKMKWVDFASTHDRHILLVDMVMISPTMYVG